MKLGAIEFRAPWSASLRATSIVGCVVLLFVPLISATLREHLGLAQQLLLIAVPLIVLFLTFAFAVRGYVLTADALWVRHPWHATCLRLDTLQSVAGHNEAMNGSVRVFGNGGLFSFTGWHWNRTLGLYRAFATDPSRAVILRFAKRAVVVTPDDPQRLIVRLRTQLSTRDADGRPY